MASFIAYKDSYLSLYGNLLANNSALLWYLDIYLIAKYL